MRITPGMMTDGHDGPLVVFLIGMRVNHWWRPAHWVPPLLAMGPMLRELYAAQQAGGQAHLGFLGHRAMVGRGGITMLQYWRTVEDLQRFTV